MKVIKYYPYRTGIVRGTEIPRELMRSLEEALYKEIKVKHFDNHVCFSVIDERHKPFAVMFHDLVCII